MGGTDGRIHIDGISPGEHTVRMWHEGWRMRREDLDSRPEFSAPIVQERRVTFAAGQTATVDFELRR